MAVGMMDHDEEHFEQADSGASTTIPKQCSALRKGEHVMIKGRPCKIVDMSTSKTGKHGHAKVHLIALDIFTGKKLEDICPSTHNMDVPVVRKKEYMLIDIGRDGFCALMDPETSETKHDIRIPEGEEGAKIRAAFEKDEGGINLVVTAACGEEMVVSFKNMPKDN